MTARASGSARGSADRLDSAAASPTGVVAWYAQGFADRLGDRLLLFDNTGAAPLELLRLAQRLTTDPAFEPALRERVEELKPFRHPAFARVRGVSVLAEPSPQLALVSEHIPGERLSQILRAARAAGFRPDPGTALWLVRQLMPAIAALHEMGAEIAHGALSPDRIIVTPTGDLVVTEYVLAHALEQLDAKPSELWRELGVAVSPTAGRPNQRGDIEQVALLALAVLLGRPLGPDEYPRKVGQLLDEACDPKRWSLVPPLRTWLRSALALNSRPFATAVQALDTLDELLPRVSGMWAARLLPQNVAATAPDEAPLPAPAHDARGAAPVQGRAAAESRPSATPVTAPERLADTAVTTGAAIRAGVAAPSFDTEAGGPSVRPERTDVRPSPSRVDLASRSMGRDAQTRWASPDSVAIAPSGNETRLWLVCAGVTGIALLEAVCLVLVLSGQRLTGPTHLAVTPGTASAVDGAGSAGAPTDSGEADTAPAPPGAGPRIGDGWVTLESPVRLDVHVDGRFHSAGKTLRLPLAPGRHEIVLTSDAHGFRSTQRIDVVAGGVVSLKPDVAR